MAGRGGLGRPAHGAGAVAALATAMIPGMDGQRGKHGLAGQESHQKGRQEPRQATGDRASVSHLPISYSTSPLQGRYKSAGSVQCWPGKTVAKGGSP